MPINRLVKNVLHGYMKELGEEEDSARDGLIISQSGQV